MLVGVPKEIKNNENRVAMTPAGVFNLCSSGHEVVIETGAGAGSSFTDEEYINVGAKVVATAEEAWKVDMVLKVKEPIPAEYGYFREGLILFTYLHLASDSELTKELLNKKVIAIAYETVQLPNNTLPLLAPMSEVAGRMATLIGAQYLQQTNGGKGMLLSGVPGVSRGSVAIIGGGQAGTNAARIAVGMGAKVTVLDLSVERLRQLDDIFGNDVQTLVSNPLNIAESVKNADLVVGAVLIPGTKAPKLVSEDMVKSMKPGSVIVDIAIDQGGIFATSDQVTTHDNPIYVKHDIVHYTVANMPGAVPQTSTTALTNVTVPYALQIANKGYKRACLENLALQKGINTLDGHITYKAVANAFDMECVSAETLLNRVAVK